MNFSSVLAGCLISTFACGQALADSFDSVNRGWFEAKGLRLAASTNTFTGSIPPDQHYNSFFVFDLSDLDRSVEAGTLRLELESYWGPDPSEPFTVYDVVSDPLELAVDQVDRTDIFDDLQSGVVYGVGSVRPSDVGLVIEVELSDDAIVDLNAAIGGLFAVGVHVDDIGGLGSEEGMRWSLTGEDRVDELVLALGPQFDVELGPEMALHPVDASHVVTAQLRDFRGDPVPATVVDFEVREGPNAGASGSMMTDPQGEASFSYPGSGDGPGIDSIVASVDSADGETLESELAVAIRDQDCNENGVADTCDVSCDGFDGMCADAYAECGGSVDADADGAPDECSPAPEPTCTPGNDVSSEKREKALNRFEKLAEWFGWELPRSVHGRKTGRPEYQRERGKHGFWRAHGGNDCFGFERINGFKHRRWYRCDDPPPPPTCEKADDPPEHPWSWWLRRRGR